MKKKHILILHVMLWAYLLYPAFSPLIFPNPSWKIDKSYFMAIPMDIFISFLNFYLFYYLVMPLFFRKQKVIFNIFIAISFLIVFTAIRYLIYYICNIYIYGTTKADLYKELSSAYTISKEIRATMVFGLYAFFTRFTIDWFNNQKQKADLINQTQASELSLLKSQINPHFLFNTLNNIYSLVYKKSDEAPEAITKLSSIMRYTLYESTTDRVPLSKEIEYLESYIELQQLRFKSNNFVEFNIEGNIDQQTIVPMIFISFVENAFKHGSKNSNIPGVIINLKATSSNIYFEISNYKNENSIQSKDKVGGIGLQNIKRRLELLYKNCHKLEIAESEQMFTIKLELTTTL